MGSWILAALSKRRRFRSLIKDTGNSWEVLAGASGHAHMVRRTGYDDLRKYESKA